MNSLTRATTTQSASTATTTTSTSFDTTTKKKFGKNLNKLTAPPVAPVAQVQSKSNSSSKNGYLLLSTKRPSSGSNTATASGGILSSKSAQNTAKIPSLGLHTEFSSSTHDALLGVVVGASRLESQQQPDAWGVAEKQQQQQSQNTQVQALQQQQKPKVDPTVVTKVSVDIGSHEGPFDTKKKAIISTCNESNNGEQIQDQERNNDDSLHEEFRTSNWDEYGGRDIQANNDGNMDTVDEADDVDQRVVMKKLARERAEKIRDEEESRMLEQKERAAQRLKELEEKMAAKKEERVASAKYGRECKILKTANIDENSSRPRFQLEELNKKKKESGTVSSPKRESNPQRTLYDPNTSTKSYSALVAGSTPTNQEKIIKKSEPNTHKTSLPLSPSIQKGVVQPQGTYSADPESFDRQSVIQLVSYDDGDRGDRNANATPRMLFDPKSGSMVEVNSRDEISTTVRNRKERVKKKKSSREKLSKKDLIVDGGSDTKGGRRNKSRRDSNSVNQRSKGVGAESSSTSKSDTRKVKIAIPRKLPRTCGVLYSREKKGGFYCVDGCEGDLGYGVHSIPGGRVKNSEAYSNDIENQNQIKQENMVKYDSMKHGRSLNSKIMDNENDVTIETGFHISKAKEPKHDWIKPNEKIELITGVEDSPTLQATAREFAPTHTAIALVEREKMTLSSAGGSDDDDDDDEDENDDVTPLGLGFDPALNMVSVMQSPSIDVSDGLNAVDLTTLSLEPALQGPAKNSHIFAFESGATWGASNSEGNNDWGVHSGSSTFGNGTSNNVGVPATFLSLTTGNTWGGFGTGLNGENTKSSGE
mmetsp:Transcript_55517/g.62099  ORF Transcript_55517/g.62099 Transcript_55517/m.62099 type:complete len:817 (-) Transcript_55517:448-2898(-)